MTCESCFGKTRALWASSDIPYYRCISCGLVQFASSLNEAAANAIYDDSYFNGGGAGYPDYLQERPLLRDHGQRYAAIVSKFMRPGHLLDVGGAAGYIASGFCQAGWNATVLEPNSRMAAIAASLGESAHVGVMERFQAPRTFDLILMIQVIAHFFDLRKALASAAAANTNGGYLLVETWNRDSVTARLLRRRWHEFSPPSVRRIFTPVVLDRALAEYGYLRVSGGRPHKWLSGLHAKSLLEHRAEESFSMRAASWLGRLIPDAMKVPYPAEDLFWALYRKTGAANAQARAESSVA